MHELNLDNHSPQGRGSERNRFYNIYREWWGWGGKEVVRATEKIEAYKECHGRVQTKKWVVLLGA